jgi:hypothetical protein
MTPEQIIEKARERWVKLNPPDLYGRELPETDCPPGVVAALLTAIYEVQRGQCLECGSHGEYVHAPDCSVGAALSAIEDALK